MGRLLMGITEEQQGLQNSHRARVQRERDEENGFFMLQYLRENVLSQQILLNQTRKEDGEKKWKECRWAGLKR